MGAVFHCETFDGKLTEDQVRKEYLSIRDNMEYEHGTDPYNGTWSTLEGSLVIHREILESNNAAHDFIDQRSEKRGAAHAVRFKDIRTEPTKTPTFRGKPWHEHAHIQFNTASGEYYSTRAIVRVWTMLERPHELAAADSLPPTVQAKLVTAAQDWLDKRRAYEAIHSPLAGLAQRVAAPKLELTSVDFTNMRKLRKQLEKSYAALSKATAKLHELDTKHAEKLYANSTIDHGLRWLVGGLCAE